MPDDIDSSTLARYLSGELAPADAARVERWVAADAANGELVASLRQVWDRGAPREFDAADAVWRRIAARLERPHPRPALVREGGSAGRPTAGGVGWPVRWVVRVLPVAAAVILAVGGVTLVSEFRDPPPPMPLREVATRRGQRAVLDLPDGSRAVLAPDTRLRFAASLGARRRAGTSAARDLFLEGEGYFEVQHDSTRPFRVHVANAVVEDIATEFVVASRAEKPGVEVVVVAGAVTLRRDSSNARPLLRLSRGDLARVDSLGTAVLTRNVNLDRYVAWTRGTLVFDGTPLREAAASLSRWFDLDISIAGRGLAQRRLTATFGAEAAPQVLELIARSLDAHVARSGRAVVFSKRGGQ